MWRLIIVSLALICLGLLGYYAVSKRSVQISAGLAVNATKTVQARVAGVRVEVVQRDARLVGRVSSDALKADAERLVAGLSGIKTVKNELEVVPIEPPAPEPAPEPAPAPEMPPTPPKGPDAPPPADPEPPVPAHAPLQLEVTWDGTTLTAIGALPEGLRKDIGLSFVSDFPDAIVKDAITITTNPGTPALAGAMKTAVRSLARLQSGKVHVTDEDFELNGIAASADDEAAVKTMVGDEIKTLASTVTVTVAGAPPPGPAPEPIPAEGPLTVALCQTAIDRLLEGDQRVTFKGPTGRLSDESGPKLEAVWALLQRCPDARGQIVGLHDDMGEPDKVKQLSWIRAFNVHKRLVELGMDKDRFKIVGLGQRDFRYPNKGDTRVLNQRIEFRLEVQ